VRLPPEGKRTLIWDLETAGVQGLCADRGYIVCFGWKWLGESQAHCISLLDYPGRGGQAKWPSNCQEDQNLLRAALEIMEQAELLVAHYGEKFDRPFFESRLLQAGLKPIPMVRQADTCLIARYKLKLSSNRLANVASFLKVKTEKMQKGSGWPDWWLGALRGDKESIKKMSVYCAKDVQCLEEVFKAMRHVIPDKYLLNAGVNELMWKCPSCGGGNRRRYGYYWTAMQLFSRYQCKGCGAWSRSRKAIKKAP